MSINLSFTDNLLRLHQLKLPTRYYHFKGEQNYIKFLSIGEGIFPKDRIRTTIRLEESDALFTTESATKVYPSTYAFGVNQITITLKASNLEFINDELILFNHAKYIQLLTIDADEDSTLFFGDILSQGRSHEHFDFDTVGIKNSFYCDGRLEYLEKYTKKGSALQSYLHRHDAPHALFAKVYIKLADNEAFMQSLMAHGFFSFTYSNTKKMLIGVESGESMADIKRRLMQVWELYRGFLGKEHFHLGKQ